jgi:hypothetical protein
MSDFLTTPGFLGTRATLRSDLTLILTLVTAGMFIIGFVLARRKQFTAHRWVQTAAVITNSLVVLISMLTSYIIYILPDVPEKFGESAPVTCCCPDGRFRHAIQDICPIEARHSQIRFIQTIHGVFSLYMLPTSVA